ncbi:MAG: PAS domain S-box protein [Dehalococcoidia bacterium]|nr:PAS domain S-box protein [Dehalococcoidia bacterium]
MIDVAVSLLRDAPAVTAQADLQAALQTLQHALAASQTNAEASAVRSRELLAERDDLIRERARYEDLFERAPDAYFVTGSHGKVLRANGAAGRLLGTARAAIIGKPIFLFLRPEDRPPLRRLLLTARQQQTVGAFPLRFAPVRSKTEIDALVSLDVDEPDARGGAPEVRWLIRDVTERRRAEEGELERRQLERLNRDKDALLGMVSHELRTPMTVIYGFAEVLRRHARALSDAEATEAVDEIYDNSRRLGGLIENMLTLARFESMGLDREPVLLQRVLPEFVEAARKRNRGREIRLVLDQNLRPVLGEPTYIRQIVDNLISNAAKYSPAETAVEVRASQGSEAVTVSVLDDGAGIGAADMERVFEPFVRSDDNAVGVPGVGLGLTVCKRLVRALGGEMWLRHQPGHGLEASFTVPLFDSSRTAG